MSSVCDDPTPVGQPDAEVEAMLADAGFVVTEQGRARWRERLATPIPSEALAAGGSQARGAHRRAA